MLELTLGSVPPELSINASDSLSTSERDSDGLITLDVGFKWAGDPNIVILLKSHGIPLVPAQLKKFQLYGTLRVVLGPLIGQMPILRYAQRLAWGEASGPSASHELHHPASREGPSQTEYS